ncbi:hypothetical protein [Bradyrhizobium sp. 153]|uniref:hypothetical protein n=1 Tax=Bradyrhizobium sp. 153 TaxID=2782627 RepID=UPI001FFA26EF|nr:hypothetical protein [Bradyrhizobium sp. 153]MCK1668675.1 hypothetical protein [Bradyrhizobium sp. 153]
MNIELVAIPGSKGDKDIMRGAVRWGSVCRSSHGVYRLKDASGHELPYRIRPGKDSFTVHDAIDDAILRRLMRDPAELKAEARARRLEVRSAFARAEREEREAMDARAARIIKTLPAPLAHPTAASLHRAIVDAMRWAQTI